MIQGVNRLLPWLHYPAVMTVVFLMFGQGGVKIST